MGEIFFGVGRRLELGVSRPARSACRDLWLCGCQFFGQIETCLPWVGCCDGACVAEVQDDIRLACVG